MGQWFMGHSLHVTHCLLCTGIRRFRYVRVRCEQFHRRLDKC